MENYMCNAHGEPIFLETAIDKAEFHRLNILRKLNHVKNEDARSVEHFRAFLYYMNVIFTNPQTTSATTSFRRAKEEFQVAEMFCMEKVNAVQQMIDETDKVIDELETLYGELQQNLFKAGIINANKQATELAETKPPPGNTGLQSGTNRKQRRSTGGSQGRSRNPTGQPRPSVSPSNEVYDEVTPSNVESPYPG
ncbi:hypothetical protein BLNAU_423 [Blattamonas nauphoetae]|uniref:Uncharacterized protein n=1 Tax=Blattamonas nauphoetae TaxID=2049346 RepID=A0ABQ9YL86_9EUKA|nr:hypothetical protein BLNAU_423 [Blattamonas nauphoetae]